MSQGPISCPLPLTPGAIPLLLDPAIPSPHLMAEPELRPRLEGESWRALEARLSRDTAGRQAGMGSAVSPGAGGGGKKKAPGWEGGCRLRASELLGLVTTCRGSWPRGCHSSEKGAVHCQGYS